MLILLTNDDGIYAPGLAALHQQLEKLGEVYLVAPATEQSGVAHSITYLTPLIVKEVFHGEHRWGWAVEGSPADCVKIGVHEFCPRKPDLVVSGINSGFNAGINVLYSGTVAAAIEGAFFGITSVAVSQQFDEHADYDQAARLAAAVIEKIVAQQGAGPQLYNMNIPTTALSGTPRVATVPMNVTRYGDSFERRTDPWGRVYYWLTGGPPSRTADEPTDLSALAEGCISLTPLGYDMTSRPFLRSMQSWNLDLEGVDAEQLPAEDPDRRQPMFRTTRQTGPVESRDKT